MAFEIINLLTYLLTYLRQPLLHADLFTRRANTDRPLRTCGMNIRRSCTMAWNHASTKSACERDTLPDLLTYSGLQASNVRSRFFFSPGGAWTPHRKTPRISNHSVLHTTVDQYAIVVELGDCKLTSVP